MKTLIDLTQVVETFRTNHRKSDFSDNNSKFEKLQKGILGEKYSTDSEAMTDLYGFGNHVKTYQKLKERYRQSLAAQLLSYNMSRHFHSNYGNVLYNCMSTAQAAQVLLQKGKQDAAEELLRIALSTAEKYYLTEWKLFCLRKLRYISSLEGDSKRFIKLNNRLKVEKEFYNAELSAEEHYEELLNHFVHKANPHEIMLAASAAFDDTKALLERYDNYNIRLFYYRIAIKYYHLNNMNNEVINVCDEALEYLKKYKAITHNVRFGEFTMEKMENLMLIKNYEEGRQCAEKCLFYLAGTGQPQLVFMEYYFLLCMHTRHYEEARAIYKKVTNSASFLNQHSVHTEKWKIFKNYLGLVTSIKSKSKNGLIDFALFQCVKDKTGYNLANSIAEIIKLLLNDEIGKLEIREESFNIYVRRYINSEHFPRSYYFCKLIQLLFKTSFNPAGIAKDSMHYKAMFAKHSDLEHFEVIPYEHLWEIIVGKLAMRENEKGAELMAG